MRILDYGLKALLAEHHERLIGSLLEDGIDIEKRNWDHNIVVNNAKQCARILMLYEKSQDAEFFPIILNGLREERYYSIMAYIFFTAECRHAPPPYSIVRYAVDDELLEEFCIILREELLITAESEGYWSWFDQAISLPIGYYST